MVHRLHGRPRHALHPSRGLVEPACAGVGAHSTRVRNMTEKTTPREPWQPPTVDEVAVVEDAAYAG